ncbi:MAG: hypothetical protein H7061_08740 [Bdellovibrionaceae bacterium]|nr:hypothetical protein [Bdellovibrio sp.]
MSFKKMFLASVIAVTFTAGASVAIAETVGEKVSEAGSDMKKSIKKGARNVKDKTCEMVNGKMECAAKKIGHKLQNAGDEISDKANDHK